MKKYENRLIDSTMIQKKAIEAVKRDATGTVQWSNVGTAQGTGITGTGSLTTTITTTLTGNEQILFQKYAIKGGIQAKTVTVNTIAGGATAAQTTVNTTTTTTKTLTNENTNSEVKFQAVFKFTGVTAGQTPFTCSLKADVEDRQGLAF